MNGKLAGILFGLGVIFAGILLLAVAWASSNLYNSTVDTIFYSPLLDWGLVVIGIIIIILIVVFLRES